MSYHVSPVAPVLPRLGRPSIGALPPAPAFRSGTLGAVPKMTELTLDQRVAIVKRGYGADAANLFRACYTDKLDTRSTYDRLTPCYTAATRELPTLKGDQLSFYHSCMAQRGSDVPMLLQHSACYAEAKKLSPGAATSAPSAPYTPPTATPAPTAPAPESAGGMSKWVWIGGAAAVAALAFVVLKPKAA